MDAAFRTSRLKAAAAVLCALAARAAAGDTPEYSLPERLGVISDPRLPEVSGIVPVTDHPRRYWAHNDSGDKARLLVIEDTGSVVAEVLVRGAAATDWEDIAKGPAPPAAKAAPGRASRDGRPRLYIADTGNNDRSRRELVIWKIPEPEIPRAPPKIGEEMRLETEPALALRFHYPGEPKDCEAIVVHAQTGRVYLLTKELFRSDVYWIDGSPEAPVPPQTAEKVAQMSPGFLVTGADLSSDAHRLVLRTYLQVQEYDLPPGRPFEEIFEQPKHVLPSSYLEVQGEAIAYDADGSIITLSEANPRVIHRIRRRKPTAPAGPPAAPSVDSLLQSFRTALPLRVEIAAAEPDVIDPVAAVFDEAEQLWVVEMGDYPLGPKPGEAPKGRIKMLDDSDGDGRFTLRSVFAEGLLFPTGAAPWRHGLLVTTMRQILYLRDSDGNGVADTSQVVADGFHDENSQLLPNHPTWSIDNGFYVANGLRATDVRVPLPQGGIQLEIRGRDLRIEPTTWQAEAASGGSQFGLAMDDEGRRFICSNRNHLQHVVLEDRYARRNPRATVPTTVEDVPDHGPAARIFPLSQNWTTSNLHAGTFTAACGVHVYRGDRMTVLRGDAFVCDPTGNLVHRDRLQYLGSTFAASRAAEDKDAELLRSPSEWFRPVNVTSGPDGGLYVVDICRRTIEHPHWMPPEQVRRFDFTAGNDCGRIWRLVPAEPAAPAPRRPVLASAPLDELIAALGARDGWRRDTAQRLIVERQGADAARALEQALAAGPTRGLATESLFRLHALWTLEGLGKTSLDALSSALADTDPAVRRAALRLSESRFGDHRELAEQALRLVNDSDRGVRFQLALSLGALAPERTTEVLRRIALRESSDRWFRSAVLLSAGDPVALATAILATRPRAEDSLEALFGDLVRAAGAGGSREIAIIARGAAPGEPRWLQAAALGFLRAGGSNSEELWLRDAARTAEQEAADATVPLVRRRDALELLSYLTPPSPVIQRVLDSPAEPGLHASAARAAIRAEGAAGLARILERWPSAGPELRRAIVDSALTQPGLATSLIEALAAGKIHAPELEAPERERLLRHGDANLRARAAELLGGASDRAAAMLERKDALSLPGDIVRGQAVFVRVCARCHRVAGLGVDTGPDISDARERTPDALLRDILDPNRAVDGRYLGYSVTTRDGRVVTGVLDGETSASITLRRADGEAETLARSAVEDVVSTGLSFMPEGLEKDLSSQDLADVIHFLKEWRFVPSEVTSPAADTRGDPPGKPAK